LALLEGVGYARAALSRDLPAPPKPLPRPPAVEAVVVEDRSATASAVGGFVNLRRLHLAVRAPDGALSPPFPFDIATRQAIDAVVVVAHFVHEGERHVYLRSTPRPALLVHDGAGGPREGNLWELAAGLIEPGESPRTGGARELHEELGFELHEERLLPLGGPTYPAPGFIAERHHYFHVEVDPSSRKPPLEDGSPLEQNAMVVTSTLLDALAHCVAGTIVDAKTELALRRLAEILA
jgi:ADP-ribose pyrophosphatase